MKRLSSLAFLVMMFWTHSAAAQEPADSARARPMDEVQGVIEDSGIEAAIDSIAMSATPELQEALDQLAETMSVIADRIANDPELRTSALRAAEGVVELAQVVVAEQSDVILDVLREAADRISTDSRAEEPEPATP